VCADGQRQNLDQEGRLEYCKNIVVVCNGMMLLAHAAAGRKPCVAFVGSS
jgi:hypothetical protein